MFKAHNGKVQVFEGSSRPGINTGKDSIRLFPMGGSGNVTKNMFVYEYRVDGVIRDIVIVDCGIGFPDPDMFGVDLVIPDVKYLGDKLSFVRGIVFSHGHDDHIGGIPFVYHKLGKIPMWAPPLAAAFANLKLKDRGIKTRVTPVNFDQTLHLGVFRISFVRVTHSIPDTSHVVIETPLGIFYHGSDFKFDFSPLDGKQAEIEKIVSIGKKGVYCMLTDSLGSERPGMTASEQVVGETLAKEMAACPGKFIFTTQSSNISRVQLAIDVALKHGRQIAFFGRSMDQNVEESCKLGYMKFPREAIIREADLKRLHPAKQCLIVAGSQGQPESALSRIANDEHRLVHINEGDSVVFSADPIPGNEHNIEVLIEQLYRKGARVSYGDIMEDLHVSGHGSQGDLMLLLSSLGPKYVFPIGGTYKHIMQYRRLALELGYQKKEILIPEEGEIIEFTRHSPPRVCERVNLENVMVDGLGVGDVGEVVLRDRQTIATEGIVVVVIPIEESTGKVTSQPDIISRGFVYMKDSEDLIRSSLSVINNSLKLKKGRMIDWVYVRKRIETNLATYLHKQTGRRPLIVPVIVEV